MSTACLLWASVDLVWSVQGRLAGTRLGGLLLLDIRVFGVRYGRIVVTDTTSAFVVQKTALCGWAVCVQISRKLAGAAAGTATWATNISNEHGQILISVLTVAEGTYQCHILPLGNRV